uniref:RHS repeat domain-containing protein n=1 Tax=Paracoccus mutanolyticus TaxID=1499308 RepID=UPI0037C5A3A8
MQLRYDRLGQLASVIDQEGIRWAFTYDIYGNRLTSDDPGLGLWTMTYDANNNARQTPRARSLLSPMTRLK